jgi:hypothetical protein
MGMYIDFCVKYDPQVDTKEDVTKRIFYAMYIKRMKGKKPATTGMFGDSGEGKSETAIAICDMLLKMQGIDIMEVFNDINICTPLEYPQKMDLILRDKRLKDVNVAIMHEARDIIKAVNWRNFLSQAVADTNAQARSIKRIAFIIVSQFIKDITREMRYTISYYMKVYRPIGKKVQLTWYVLYKDDKDIEVPTLRKRRLRGYLQYPNGRKRLIIPKYIEITRPRKELVEMFEKIDRESKGEIIKKRLEKLVLQMKLEMQVENIKVDTMVKYYGDHQETLHLIGTWGKKGFKVKDEIKLMHDISTTEKAEFEKKLNEHFINKGKINMSQKIDELNEEDYIND